MKYPSATKLQRVFIRLGIGVFIFGLGLVFSPLFFPIREELRPPNEKALIIGIMSGGLCLGARCWRLASSPESPTSGGIAAIAPDVGIGSNRIKASAPNVRLGWGWMPEATSPFFPWRFPIRTGPAFTVETASSSHAASGSRTRFRARSDASIAGA